MIGLPIKGFFRSLGVVVFKTSDYHQIPCFSGETDFAQRNPINLRNDKVISVLVFLNNETTRMISWTN